MVARCTTQAFGNRAEARWTHATHQRFFQGSVHRVHSRREPGSQQRTLQSILSRGRHRADVEAPSAPESGFFCRETSRSGVAPAKSVPISVCRSTSHGKHTQQNTANVLYASRGNTLSYLPSLPSRLRARRLGDAHPRPFRVRRVRRRTLVSARATVALRVFFRVFVFARKKTGTSAPASFARVFARAFAPRRFLAPPPRASERPIRGDGRAPEPRHTRAASRALSPTAAASGARPPRGRDDRCPHTRRAG